MNYTELFYELSKWTEEHRVSIQIQSGFFDRFLFSMIRDNVKICRLISCKELEVLDTDGIPIILNDMLKELERESEEE